MYDFVDARKMAEQNPATFEVPSEREFRQMRKGDHVKVSLNLERFWIKVEKIEGEHIFGRLANHLHDTPELKHWDKIECEFRHVYEIQAG